MWYVINDRDLNGFAAQTEGVGHIIISILLMWRDEKTWDMHKSNCLFVVFTDTINVENDNKPKNEKQTKENPMEE